MTKTPPKDKPDCECHLHRKKLPPDRLKCYCKDKYCPCNRMIKKEQLNRNKTLKMFVSGQWVEWDGRDVDKLIMEEVISYEDYNKYYKDGKE